MRRIGRIIGIALGATLAAGSALADEAVIDRALRLTKGTAWQPVATVPVKFPTHHPQGMVRIGETYFASSVEIITPTTRFATPQDGFDRDTGAGTGHLFKFDKDGALIKDLTLGEGSVYHPGGIDWDGRWIWVPVAEYRPNSRAIIYRVDPETMQATEVFRFPDHIGGIVHNTTDHTLHGVSWGSRRLYRWTLDDTLKVTDASRPPEQLRTLNKSHYIDYQDCKYEGRRMMLCTGVNAYQRVKDGPVFWLGGIELVDLASNAPVHQVPTMLWTTEGLTMTHNPAWIETSAAGLRAYFMPEDDKSTVYIFDAPVGP
jgi:hypothetical protein